MTIIYFILILGITITIHEFGHFIFAKKSGIHCYEFSIGMGPRLLKFNRKNDETDYCLRLFPIGGYVSMAGEQNDTDENVAKDKHFINKPWHQKLIVVLAGVTFNFLLAIVLLFIVGLINGVPSYKAQVGDVIAGSPAALAGLQEGAIINKINDQKVASADMFTLYFQKANGKEITLETDKGTYTIKPSKNKDYTYGFKMGGVVEKGFIPALKYSFWKFYSLIVQMIFVIGYLITGNLGLNNLAGPVGIYNIVGQSAEAGFINVVFLTALICINVGLINLLPFPAFDGFRAVLLIIEKITKKKINSKFETIVNGVGLVLLILLMIVITYNDILRLIS